MAYRTLSYRVYKNNNAKAWDILESALADKQDKDSLLMHFYLGRLSADRNYRPKDGLAHLLHYAWVDIRAGG